MSTDMMMMMMMMMRVSLKGERGGFTRWKPENHMCVCVHLEEACM